MSIYDILPIGTRLEGNTYPGRGIVIGKSEDGKKAVIAYFIMGRSQNSRNRVFVVHDGDLFTEPYDESKVEDPSLIIYAAVRSYDKYMVVTNGDQTDTVVKGLRQGQTFTQALRCRAFEPDAPNFTPRISGMLTFDRGDFTYEMSILKSIDEKGSACARYTFAYPSQAGLGHFIHTYVCDGNPIPTFQGEPERICLRGSIDDMTQEIWSALDKNNRISLFVRTRDLETGETMDRLINANGEK